MAAKEIPDSDGESPIPRVNRAKRASPKPNAASDRSKKNRSIPTSNVKSLGGGKPRVDYPNVSLSLAEIE